MFSAHQNPVLTYGELRKVFNEMVATKRDKLEHLYNLIEVGTISTIEMLLLKNKDEDILTDSDINEWTTFFSKQWEMIQNSKLVRSDLIELPGHSIRYHRTLDQTYFCNRLCQALARLFQPVTQKSERELLMPTADSLYQRDSTDLMTNLKPLPRSEIPLPIFKLFQLTNDGPVEVHSCQENENIAERKNTL